MKTALVTGASKGIGLAITEKLLEAGFFVYGCGRSMSKLKHKNFDYTKMDLTDYKNLKILEKKIKKLDILVNNAGVGFFKPLRELKEREIEETMTINAVVPILLTRLFIPKLIKSEGHVINMASRSGYIGQSWGTVYCASKFALRGFSDALFDELMNYKVRVTVVNPGIVKTTFFDNKTFAPEDNEYCYVTADDIAEVVMEAVKMRKGSVLKEVHVWPQRRSLIKKKTHKKLDK